MFIMLRESIEACVVVALLLNMCTRLKLNRMRKQVWWGAASGILVSVLLGIVFVTVFYLTKSKVMTGASKAIFKGYINLVAVLLITMLSFAMLRFMNYEKKWADKLEAAAAKIDVGRANQWSVFFLAFTAVFREGVESVIFLAGVSTTSSWTAIPLAGIVGVLLGLAVGFALYYTGRQIKDIAWFFVLSCTLLFFIAAGLTSLAMVRGREELVFFVCFVSERGSGKRAHEREREREREKAKKKTHFFPFPYPHIPTFSLPPTKKTSSGRLAVHRLVRHLGPALRPPLVEQARLGHLLLLPDQQPVFRAHDGDVWLPAQTHVHLAVQLLWLLGHRALLHRRQGVEGHADGRDQGEGQGEEGGREGGRSGGGGRR